MPSYKKRRRVVIDESKTCAILTRRRGRIKEGRFQYSGKCEKNAIVPRKREGGAKVHWRKSIREEKGRGTSRKGISNETHHKIFNADHEIPPQASDLAEIALIFPRTAGGRDEPRVVSREREGSEILIDALVRSSPALKIPATRRKRRCSKGEKEGRQRSIDFETSDIREKKKKKNPGSEAREMKTKKSGAGRKLSTGNLHANTSSFHHYRLRKRNFFWGEKEKRRV